VCGKKQGKETEEKKDGRSVDNNPQVQVWGNEGYSGERLPTTPYEVMEWNKVDATGDKPGNRTE
jgi:hypothetical protein